MDELEVIRKTFPLSDYIKRNYDLGKETKVSGGYLYKKCPLCGSTSPKKDDNGHFFLSDSGCSYCSFAECGVGRKNGGSAIDFIMEAEGLSLAEAIKKTKSIMGIDNNFVEKERKVSNDGKAENKMITEFETEEKASEDLSFISQELSQRKVEDVANIVEKRGIKRELVEKYNIFVSSKTGFSKLYIPIKEGGQFVGYVSRALQEEDTIRYKNNRGTIFPFNRDYYRQKPKAEGERIFLCEGVFDMLSLESEGEKAISINSVGNVNKLIEDIKQHFATSSLYEFVLAFDNDEAGQNATTKAQELFQAINKEHEQEGKIHFSLLEIPQQYKDVNEWYQEEPGELIFKLKDTATNLDYLTNIFLNDVNKLKKYKERKTGFPELDKQLNGIVPGLYVLGAISSLGKTTFISQIADQMAQKGEKILFFSLEQSRFELVAKSLSRETWKVQNPKTALQIMQMESISEEVIQAIENYEKFAGNITTIEGNFGMNVFKVRDIVETYIKTNRTRPVVVVDYLQILNPTNDRLTDKAQVDFNVSELKRISRDNNITIFVVCSFNRENYNAPVDFRSFKESGAIEYGADVVLGLQLSVLNNLPNNLAEQREEINRAKSSSPRDVELVCLKNRNGKPYFKCSYRYHSAYNYFVEAGVLE